MKFSLRSILMTGVLLCLLATTAVAEVVVDFQPFAEAKHVTAQTAPKQLAVGPSVVLPFYLADLVNPLGEATLYAVRNNSANPVAVRFSYYNGFNGNLVAVEESTIAPYGVRSVNLREVNGLPFGAGITTGYMVATTIDTELPDSVISGDYFRVDILGAAANGGGLMDSKSAECRRWSHRFFSGGDINGTARIAFMVRNAPAEGPVVSGNVYDEAGNQVGVVSITSSRAAFEVTDLDLQLPVEFGSIDWVFEGEAYGAVTTTLASEPLFSVGADATCTEELDGNIVEPPPPGAVTFELPGNFFTCRRCANWQYDMNFPARQNFSKVVIEFDIFIAGWDSNRPNGFHCLFWFNNGSQWRDMLGYMNSRGTQNRNVFQSNGPLGNPIGVEKYASPGVLVGQTYSVHYEYDTVEKVTWYEIRDASGAVRVADFISLPSNTGPVSTNYAFIQFGTQIGVVEAATENWRWSNFRAQFIP